MNAEKSQEDYNQNYDVVFKWIANVLTGKTLEVLGIKTGKIVDVVGLEPITLQAKEERVDLLLRDEDDQYYRLEEERNLSLSDLYRFASQHFLVVEQLKLNLRKKVKDIIIASGIVTPQRSLQTGSATYNPEIIDLTQKDGRERLKKMQEEGGVDEVELLFLPMYGKEEDSESFAREVLFYAKQMYLEKKIKLEFVGALIIICNKIVSKEILNNLWRELSMLKVFKYAEEIGIDKGFEEGIEKGRQEGIEEGIEKGRQEGIEKGIEKGRQEGIEKGIEKGRQEGMKEMFSILLEMRYGENGLSLMPDILAIKDVSKLKIIKDALKKNMLLEDLKKIIELLKE